MLIQTQEQRALRAPASPDEPIIESPRLRQLQAHLPGPLVSISCSKCCFCGQGGERWKRYPHMSIYIPLQFRSPAFHGGNEAGGESSEVMDMIDFVKNRISADSLRQAIYFMWMNHQALIRHRNVLMNFCTNVLAKYCSGPGFIKLSNTWHSGPNRVNLWI